MESNPFILDPPYVACIHPKTKECVNVMFFLGAVPKYVFDAAKRVNHDLSTNKMTWSATDSDTLAKFYGAKWRRIFQVESDFSVANKAFKSSKYMNKIHGISADNTNYIFGGDDFATELIEAPTTKRRANTSNTFVAPYTTKTKIAFSNIQIYPTDTVEDVKYKYNAATGISFYRMHLFYCSDDLSPTYPYNISADEAPVIPNTFDIYKDKTCTSFNIDQSLNARSSHIKVEAHDCFISTNGIRRYYYMDLFAVIEGINLINLDSYRISTLYYGVFIKLFPHLDIDALILAITDARRMPSIYPRLDPEIKDLAQKITLRNELDELALEWEDTLILGDSKRSPVAVTGASVRILPDSKIRINIRNVFDYLPLSTEILAAYSRFEIDTSGQSITDFAPDVRSGDISIITAYKRHASTYQSKHMKSIDWFISRKYNKNCVNYAINKPSTVFTSKSLTYTQLSIYDDGYIEAVGDWKEDDRKDFISTSKELIGAVYPVINSVNIMGPAALPTGGILKADKCTLGDITVTAFWPHGFTEFQFKELKTRLRKLEAADFITIHGVQQIGTYSFYFKRGIVDYMETSSNDEDEIQSLISNNKYAKFFNDQANYRWGMLYAGRQIRITHRTTDIKIDFIGIDNMDEFETVKRYVFSFLDSLLKGADKIKSDKQVIHRTTPVEANQRLKRLQEKDPELFDLKKHDAEATVYSVLCQSNRQPNIYDDMDIKTMSAKDKARLVKYWNFTTKTPAYYSCPDAHFPHISFRPGQHPLGYCLPCCKKMASVENSKAKKTDDACIKNPMAATAAANEALKDDSASSRHVLAYGKEMTVGRISEAPHEARDLLFLDVVPKPYGIYVIGVEQQVPSVAMAGFAYSLAFLLSEEDEDENAVLTTLANLARSMGSTYHSAGGGAAAVFESADALAQEIIDTFVIKTAKFSQFGSGGLAHDTWPEILCDLARHAYGVEIVMLVDVYSNGEITIESLSESVANITGRGASVNRRPPGVAMLLINESGTYPLALLNPKEFLKYEISERGQFCRRIFDYDNSADSIPDGVAAVIYDALMLTTVPAQNMQSPDLTIIVKFVEQSEYKIYTRLVDIHNRCYGVILMRDKEPIYFPIRYSSYPLDGTFTLFECREQYDYKESELKKMLDAFNKYVRAGHLKCGEIIEDRAIINDGKRMGFMSKTEPPLYFIHSPSAVKNDNSQVLLFPYDSLDIDQEILNYVRRENSTSKKDHLKEDERIKKLSMEAKKKNNLYKLFMAEFSYLIKNERNIKTRDELYKLLRSSNYQTHDGSSLLKSKLSLMLKDFVDDIIEIRSIISKYYRLDDPAKYIIADCEKTKFDFDSLLLNELRSMDYNAADKLLRDKLKNSYQFDNGADAPEISNIFVACHEASTAEHCHAHCSKSGKLIVPADRIDELFSILLGDIRNLSKMGLLSAATSGVIDEMNFIERPYEYLTIKIGNATIKQ
jgi:hypothetical protein